MINAFKSAPIFRGLILFENIPNTFFHEKSFNLLSFYP